MTETFDDFCPAPAAADALLAARGMPPATGFERWAMLGVSGRALLRKSWTSAAEVTVRGFEALRDAAEPEPDLAATTVRNHRRLVGASREAKPGRCSSCWLERGWQMCGPCGGEGSIGMGDAMTTCPACSGRRKTTCTSCEGSGVAVKVDLAFIEDRPASFAHVFVPEVPHELVTPLVDFLRTRTTIPECLRFEVGEEHARADAYRGRRGSEEYRGHRLGNASARARIYVERMRRAPTIVATEHSARAWPFALLELDGGGSAALALDEARAPQLLVPSAANDAS
jgi:hypothetical protein